MVIVMKQMQMMIDILLMRSSLLVAMTMKMMFFGLQYFADDDWRGSGKLIKLQMLILLVMQLRGERVLMSKIHARV